jgi:DNA-directed RNA polymerase sigma subunit (sigma70/sigma32)
MTLKEIGEHLGLTRERVRQIEKEALTKMSVSMQP